MGWCGSGDLFLVFFPVICFVFKQKQNFWGRNFFTLKALKPWKKMSREVVDVPSLETFNVRLGQSSEPTNRIEDVPAHCRGVEPEDLLKSLLIQMILGFCDSLLFKSSSCFYPRRVHLLKMSWKIKYTTELPKLEQYFWQGRRVILKLFFISPMVPPRILPGRPQMNSFCPGQLLFWSYTHS